MSIVLSVPAFAQIQQFDVGLPSPVAFYDFDGDGEKEFVYKSNYSDKLQFYDGILQGFVFMPEKEQIVDYMQHGEVVGIGDVNGDGIVDIGIYSEENYGRNVQNALLSNGLVYDVERMLIYPLWDAAWMDADCSDIVIYKEGAYLNDFTEIGRLPKAEGRFVDTASDNTVRSERYAIAMLMNDGTISPMSEIHQTVLRTINGGMIADKYNLIWNGYVGREIASYRILRGASPDALHEIATLSGAATSYVDASVDAEPYYALEIHPVENYYPDALGYMSLAAADESMRSNVVYSGDARNINYVEQLRILTVGNVDALTSENPVVYLYTEVLPETASYAHVIWEVVDGEEYASVDAYGIVTAKNNAQDGMVTIMATAVDGSDVTTFIQLTVEKNSGVGLIPAMKYAEVKAYPVPASDVLYISSRETIDRLQLIDMQGRVAKDVRGDNRMLDVSRIPQGTYLLRVVLADGYAVSLKIVKR